MKKILNFLAILVISFAVNNQILAASSNPTKAEFEAAKKLYDAKNYSAAKKAFEDLFDKSPSSWVVNFYLASSALELKDYDSAMAAFDRVLMLRPNHTRTRLELARLYYETKQFEMANNELDIALKSDLPDAVRQNVMALKSRMAHEDKRFNQAATLVMGLSYDSNANNDIGRGGFNLPGFGGIELEGNPEDSDLGFSQTLVYNLGYDFGARGGWVNNTQVVAYNKSNREFDANNIQLLGVNTSMVYLQDTVRLGLPLGLENLRVGGDPYLQNKYFGMNLTKLLSSAQSLKGGITFRTMDYSENSFLDAESSIFNLDYRQAVADWGMNFGLGFSFESKSLKDNPAADLHSYTETSWRLDATKPLNELIRVNASLVLRTTEYKDENWMFNSVREDKVKKLDLNTTLSFTKQVSVNLGVARLINDSNQAPFDYDKNMAYANLILGF